MPQAAARYSAALAALPPTTLGVSTLAGCLLQLPGAVAGAERATFLALFVGTVISVAMPPPPAVLQAFAPLVASLTAVEWNGSVLDRLCQ